MAGREEPHTVKYKAITNDWNYDASCMLTSLPVLNLENFMRLVFVVQSGGLWVFNGRAQLGKLKLRMVLSKIMHFVLN
jgi:hypothetical protein